LLRLKDRNKVKFLLWDDDAIIGSPAFAAQEKFDIKDKIKLLDNKRKNNTIAYYKKINFPNVG